MVLDFCQKIINSFHTTAGKIIFTLQNNLMKERSPGSRRVKKNWLKIRWVLFGLLIFFGITFLAGVFHGRFNFKYNTIEIEYENLPAGLDGFTIVHISDLHLKSFRRHPDKLMQVFDSINSYEPDIIVNTGDFVSYMYDEMDMFTGILSSLKAEYGVYAIPGNHDTGMYSTYYNRYNCEEHLDIIGEMLESSGHIYLKDTSILIKMDTLTVSITGVCTYGMIPNIYYGDTDSALVGTDSSDFSIMLTHDPNHWIKDIEYRDNIDLTLSGHTHGGQIGILLPGLKLSPASTLYPAWSGLYEHQNNYLYVNRGLGTVGFPARIGMPPEITVIRILVPYHPVTP